jgi:hypothetical protein
MKNVGHDGGEMDPCLLLVGMTAGVGLVWGALGTDPSPPAQDDNLAPLTNVGHDGGEENRGEFRYPLKVRYRPDRFPKLEAKTRHRS